ncbi:MAG TPA: thioesterase domain-containing protein [Candidatus Methylomirabilis sp.]|nr:thioesterase domain-containing protein [Candidatus Methylomirabilis sp.]
MLSPSRCLVLLFCFTVISCEASSQPRSTPSPNVVSPAAIVIGFVGGYVHHDDRVHTEVQLVDRLHEEYSPNLFVQTFENHRGKEAYQTVLRLLDADHDGILSPAEKQSARIIIFGHSWGASEALELARQLQKDGIPVLLTIQVDSVSKRGQNDSVIPANVAQAINFYQLDGLLHGQPQIRAADPARTRVLGNFRSDYKAKPLTCGQYPWYDRAFMKSHIQIECDPAVWNQVESLIRSNLSLEARVPPASAPTSSASPLH